MYIGIQIMTLFFDIGTRLHDANTKHHFMSRV